MEYKKKPTMKGKCFICPAKKKATAKYCLACANELHTKMSAETSKKMSGKNNYSRDEVIEMMIKEKN